jgi:hypothetical protein
MEYHEEDKKSTDQISDSSPIVGHIREKFQQSETSRIYDEKRWLKAYRNYRGLYGPEMAFRSNEKSRVFVKNSPSNNSNRRLKWILTVLKVMVEKYLLVQLQIC